MVRYTGCSDSVGHTYLQTQHIEPKREPRLQEVTNFLLAGTSNYSLWEEQETEDFLTLPVLNDARCLKYCSF